MLKPCFGCESSEGNHEAIFHPFILHALQPLQYTSVPEYIYYKFGGTQLETNST